MPLKPIERKAAFVAAVTLRETTKTAASLELGVSLTHLDAVLLGERDGSAELKARVAQYTEIPFEQFWGEPNAVAA